MYCYYTANASWTVDQVIDDLALLFTGSDVSSLGASCNKSLSYQTGSTISAGWTLQDASTGQPTKGVMLTASDVDGLTTKYFNLYYSTTTSINARVLEGWDAATNAATNASSAQQIVIGTLGTAFVMHVFCTPQYAFFSCQNGNGAGCLEIARDTPFTQNASPVPMVHLLALLTGFSATDSLLPRLKLPTTGATATLSTASVRCATTALRTLTAAGTMVSPQAGPLFDAAGNQIHVASPIFWGYGVPATGGYVHFGRNTPNVNGRAPMLVRTSITGATFGDILVVDGFNYVYLTPGQGVIFPLE